jgi:hypothetical protein
MASEGETAARWSPALSRGFRRYFQRLGLNCTQAMLVHELMDRLAESGIPPKLGELAICLGICQRAVRENLRQLEQRGYLRREPTFGGPNAYRYDGLLVALQRAIEQGGPR